jgi:hypothetical protein
MSDADALKARMEHVIDNPHEELASLSLKLHAEVELDNVIQISRLTFDRLSKWCDMWSWPSAAGLSALASSPPRCHRTMPRKAPSAVACPARAPTAGERHGQCLIGQEWLRALGGAAPTAFQPRACHQCRTLQTPVDARHFVECGPLVGPGHDPRGGVIGNNLRERPSLVDDGVHARIARQLLAQRVDTLEGQQRGERPTACAGRSASSSGASHAPCTAGRSRSAGASHSRRSRPARGSPTRSRPTA